MVKEEVKKRITISISPKVLRELEEHCSQIKKGLKVDRSPIIEIAIKEYLTKENGKK